MKVSHEILPPEKNEGRESDAAIRESANVGTNKAQQGQASKARTRIQATREAKRTRKRPTRAPGTLILFIKPTVKPYCAQRSRSANCALIRQPQLHGIGIHRRILVLNGRIKSF
jgi:hypothetical protein